MRIPTRVLGAIVLGATALVACQDDTAPTSLAGERLRASAQEMLRERARLLLDGDVDGYLAALAPDVRPGEEPLAQGAATVPLAELDLVLGDAEVDAPGEALRSARIDIIYRYRRLPEDNPFRVQMVADLERGDDGWVITRSGYDTTVLPLPPWATGEVEVADSEHFVALHRPGLEGVDRLLEVAEDARAALDPKLTLVPDDRHLLLLARDQAEMGSLAGSMLPPEGGLLALAAYQFESSVAYGIRPEGRYLLVDVASVFADSAVPLHPVLETLRRSPLEVFQHELAHLALSRFTRPATPVWVAEGAAMQLSGERLVDAWRLFIEADMLGEFALQNMSRQETLDPFQYPYASAAVLHLVERYGAERFWDFYQNFKDVEMGGPLEDVRMEANRRLLRRHFQIDPHALDADVREWIRGAVSGA